MAARPQVSFVVFDSGVTPAERPQAVYVDADAAEIEEPDLAGTGVDRRVTVKL